VLGVVVGASVVGVVIVVALVVVGVGSSGSSCGS